MFRITFRHFSTGYLICIESNGLELAVLVEGTPFNLADLVSPQVEDLQVAEASEGGLIDGLNVVIVQLQSAQVGKTRQGVLRKFLDQVSPEVNGVQLIISLLSPQYLADKRLKM